MKLVTLIALSAFLCPHMPAQDVRQTFQNPPKAYRPMVRWWWPGGDVTDAELRREVGLLDQANFGGAEIQPFKIGLNPDMPEAAENRVNDYLTPTFFAHVRAALDEARTRGMWLDYTFGSGWPFGGAGAITPELAAVELRTAHQSIRGPVHFHQKIEMPVSAMDVDARFGKPDKDLPQGWPARFQQREKLVAVVAVRGAEVQFYPSQKRNTEPEIKRTGQLNAGTSVVLTDHLLPDGTLDWDVPEGTWQVFTFKEMPTGQKVVEGAGTGPQFVLDHMSRHAFDIYAEQVGGKARQYDGEYFGKGLRAIFCDSLEVQAYLYWNDHFLEEFRKRRGYDLTPYLPILKVPGFAVPYNGTGARLPLYDMAGIGDQVRRDYLQTVSDVMIDNFYSPFNEWAAKNNLLSRVQAHGSPTDLLRVYGESNIPETEILYDNGRYDFLKMASSGGDLYGRKIVASESFVWKGHAYQTTPEKIKRYADELLTAGINEIIYHGYPYEYMNRPEPGWHPFSNGDAYSSHMNQKNLFWPYLAPLNQYITRLQYVSQTGITVAPVALYRGLLAYDEVIPKQPEPEIASRLMAAGYNYDHIDAYVLLQSHVAEGKLISPGGEKYSVLVLPDQKTVSAKVAGQLAAFAKLGLPIVFVGSVPATEAEVVHDQFPAASRSEIPMKLTGRNVQTTSDAIGAVKILERTVRPNLHFDGMPVPFIEKRVGTLDFFFLRNPDDAEKRVEAEFFANGAPEIWDPWTGTIRPLKQSDKHGGSVRVPLNIDAYGSTLLVFDSAAKQEDISTVNSSQRVSDRMSQIAVGQKGWKFHGMGMGPESKPEIIDLELPNLVDWSMDDRLRNFSGRGQYTTTFVVPSNFLGKKERVLLDLGDVKDVAEIWINGKAGPVLLLRPYRADVTELLRAGENSLRIVVVNTLYNALSARGPNAYFVPGPTNTENNLMSSGLIGPVRLEKGAAE